jgi:membrane-bound metal-dependent hydrolase YbcI (DUF457 family)
MTKNQFSNEQGTRFMADYRTYHLAALATGIGVGATTATLLPGAGWAILGVTALSGYAGGLLPDIDDETSTHYLIIKRLSQAAAVIVPSIQFFYRPTDLLLAIPIALFMVAQFWILLQQIIKRGGYTHSVLSAVCLSLGVSWVAYMTTDESAVVPAFLASGAGYLLHLLLDDLNRKTASTPENTAEQPSALAIIGRGKTAELYGILTIGLLCGFALWGI